MVVHSRAVDEAFSGLHWLWAGDLSPSACGLLQKAAQDLPVDFPRANDPSERNGNPLQCSCLENPVDRGAWWAAVRGGCTESDTTEAT